MKKTTTTIASAVSSTAASAAAAAAASSSSSAPSAATSPATTACFACTTHEPPKCARIPHTTNDGRNAPYYWLRRREDPAVMRYLKAENKYAEQLLGVAPQVIFRELVARERDEDCWVPYASKSFFYWHIDPKNKEHSVYYRRPIAADPSFIDRVIREHAEDHEATIPRGLPGEQMMIDLNAVAAEEQKESVACGELHISPNERRVIYSLDLSEGREVYTLVVIEYPDVSVLLESAAAAAASGGASSSATAALNTNSNSAAASTPPPTQQQQQAAKSSTNTVVPSKTTLQKQKSRRVKLLRLDGEEAIADRRYGEQVAWLSDTVFAFTKLDATLRPYQVWRYDLDPGPGMPREILVFEEKDDKFTVGGLCRSDDDAVVEFTTASKTSSEIWFCPTTTPHAAWRCIRPRAPNIEYSVVHHRSLFVPPQSTVTGATSAFDAWSPRPAWIITHNIGDSVNFQVDFALSDVPLEEHETSSSAAVRNNSNTSANNNNINDNNHRVHAPPVSATATSRSQASAPATAAREVSSLLDVNRPVTNWQPLITYDPQYTVENVVAFQNFVLVEVRYSGFSRMLVMPNAPRVTVPEILPVPGQAAAAATPLSYSNLHHCHVHLPSIYAQYVALARKTAKLNRPQSDSSKESSKEGGKGKKAVAKKPATTSFSPALTGITCGVETDPEMLAVLDTVTHVTSEGVANFTDPFFRATVLNPIFPMGEVQVHVNVGSLPPDSSSLEQPEPKAGEKKAATISTNNDDDDGVNSNPEAAAVKQQQQPKQRHPPVTLTTQVIKFAPVPNGTTGIYDPSKYGVALEWVEATQSTCPDPNDKRVNVTDPVTGKPIVKIPAVLKFRKSMCNKYQAKQALQQTVAERAAAGAAAAKSSGETAGKKKTRTAAEATTTASTPAASTTATTGNPTILWGYSAYGDSMELHFSQTHLSFLDRGIIYADCGCRGGGEMGSHWYNAGRTLNKKNSFTDFIDVAEALKARGWTEPDRLAIRGVSAGGLLVSACMTLRPDLYCAVSASVPFVDWITTMADETIPLTAAEWEEFGDPRIVEHYKMMLDLSPTDNVPPKTTVMPNVWIDSSFNDARVQYFEPAAWGALLRDNWDASRKAGRFLAHRCNINAGHDGSAGRWSFLKDLSYEYAFLIGALGIKIKRPLVETRP